MHGLVYVVTLVTAIGCGLNGGVFFAFSAFVMKALARLQSAQGVAAMQAINVGAVSLPFMLTLFGTALSGIIAAGVSLGHLGESYAPYVLAGSGVYLAGVIAVTIGFNVPLNNMLARVEPGSAEAADAWRRYLARWTAGNHVRTAAATAATATLAIALHVS
jgi:uncharacterized membrane protein